MKALLLFLVALLSAMVACSQPNPLLQVESYQLDNGFTVLLNADSTASRVYGAVMVNAGAKQELPEATGMAHYLEHLLFKGTKTLGTKDYAQEQPHLDSINRLYERLAATEDPTQQAQLQQDINAQAQAAAQFGLPNEFDRLLRNIGGTGINAFTSYEMTFYHNSFPSHEIERWLDLYATRFSDPVFRSFQSELEVVYEEKNRAMDNLERKFTDALDQAVYPNLPYGQWPVLGTVAHLKKPSLLKMYDFFEKHYVAGNMALILTGNFDAEVVKPMIEARFGPWEATPAPTTELPPLEPLTGRVVKKVRITPIKAGALSWQTVPLNHPDRLAMDLCEYLLFNQDETGLINQLQLDRELLFVVGYGDQYLDAGAFNVIFAPKPIIQSLGNVRGKIEAAIGQIKQSDISEAVFLAARNALVVDYQSQLEDLGSRGRLIGQAFNQGVTWEEFLAYPERIQRVTLAQVAAVAQRYLGDHRVELISRTGFGKAPKLDKPPYQPVTTDQNGRSPYAEQFAQIPSQPFEPRYLDFDEDLQRQQLPGGHQLLRSPNPLNDLFSLTIRWQKGRLHDPDLPLVADLLGYAGAGDLSLAALKQRLTTLGCTYRFDVGDNTFVLTLNGPEASLTEAVALMGSLTRHPQADQQTLKLVLDARKTERKLDRESPSTMARALINYGLYGEHSEYLLRPSLSDVKKVSVTALLATYEQVISQTQAEITYVGQTPVPALVALLTEQLPLAQAGQAMPYQYRAAKVPARPRVLIIDDKKAVQSQIYFYVPGLSTDATDYATVEAFNQYFGGGFSGLVTQEIREYRSLAYATGASYNLPPQPGKPGRLIGYVGCQADKTLEAIGVMQGLISDLPLKPERMPDLQRSLQMEVVTNYPDFRDIPDQIRAYERQGYASDPNRAAYAAYPSLTMEELAAFHQQAIQGRPGVITIYGNTRRFDLDQLKAFGEVEVLKLKEVWH
jgi:predicted Zn-dependent peptidase